MFLIFHPVHHNGIPNIVTLYRHSLCFRLWELANNAVAGLQVTYVCVLTAAKWCCHTRSQQIWALTSLLTWKLCKKTWEQNMVTQDRTRFHCHKAVLAVHVATSQSVQTARKGLAGESYRWRPKKIDLWLAGEPELTVKSQKVRRGITLFFLLTLAR